MPRIYLDNSATSWPKPECVYNAIDHFQRDNGASAGRGAYSTAQQAQRLVSETRAACARLFNIADPRQLIFTANGTASLNLAIHGLLRTGDHVVTTVCEHNSVLRPLHQQVEQNGVQVTHVGCDVAGFVSVDSIAEALLPRTKLVALTHASNVTGAIQPVAEIARVAHEAGALFLLDAAQTAGAVPIDVEELDVDLLACGGHKGLLGPLGTGLLYIRPGIESQLPCSQQGGTGTESMDEAHPDTLPEKYEPGSPNLPALAGLGAAVRHLEEQTVEIVHKHHLRLTTQLLAGLAAIPNAKIYGPTAEQPRVAVVSCSVAGYDPQEFAAALDASCGIECRAGLHCAPRLHTTLGTDRTGGLIRFSPGWATTTGEIKTTLKAIAMLATLATQ